MSKSGDRRAGTTAGLLDAAPQGPGEPLGGGMLLDAAGVALDLSEQQRAVLAAVATAGKHVQPALVGRQLQYGWGDAAQLLDDLAARGLLSRSGARHYCPTTEGAAVAVHLMRDE